jgi:hypothetical protein
MAQVVGFNQAVADAALAGKSEAQRKASYKKASLHISFRKGAVLENKMRVVRS